jgi:multicomponent Na+:H+ antiporter subunit D
MFFGKDSGVRGHEPPKNMLVAMGLAAAACVLIGVSPGLLYRHLPYPVEYAPYTLHHVTSTLGLLAFTALGFFLLLKHLDPEPKISLDTDWFYRRGLAPGLNLVKAPLAQLESGFVGEIYELVIRRPVLGAAGLLRNLDTRVVDFAAVGVGRLTQAFSQVLKTTVSGNAQHYGLIMAAGVLALLALTMIALWQATRS